jgi:hypothetical protein
MLATAILDSTIADIAAISSTIAGARATERDRAENDWPKTPAAPSAICQSICHDQAPRKKKQMGTVT